MLLKNRKRLDVETIMYFRWTEVSRNFDYQLTALFYRLLKEKSL